MGQFPGKHVADDLHVLMAVSAKASDGLYPVFIDDAENAKLDEVRVEVFGK
jgi:hypothetical protein